MDHDRPVESILAIYLGNLAGEHMCVVSTELPLVWSMIASLVPESFVFLNNKSENQRNHSKLKGPEQGRKR